MNSSQYSEVVLITVVMPVYNAESFLEQSIVSVLHQSYRNIELLLVNDGSTDNSLSVCDKYAGIDSRVKVFSQGNSGPAAARNTGVRNAAGDLVFFIDADDFIEQDALRVMVEHYDKYKPDLVMSNFGKMELHDKSVVNQSVTFHPENDAFEEDLCSLSLHDIDNYVRHFLKYPSNHLVSYCWARLYKLSIIKANSICANENMRLFEDLVFNLEYLKHVQEVLFVNRSLYVYRMHGSHVSASMALVNGDSLLHDIAEFEKQLYVFFDRPDVDDVIKENVKKEVGHAIVHYVIVFMVRACRRLALYNRNEIRAEFKKIINSPAFRCCLSCYCPSKGNSRLLPLLMKFRLVDLAMLLCRYKAYKRYGRPEA